MFKDNKDIVNDIVMVSLLLTLKIFHTFFSALIVDIEQVNVCLEASGTATKKLQNLDKLYLKKYSLSGVADQFCI